MISEVTETLRRLAALLTATAGLAQGSLQYGPAQFPEYAALTAEESVYTDTAYVGSNGIVTVETHSEGDSLLPCAYILADLYLPDVHELRTYYMDDPEDGLGDLAEIATMTRHVDAAFAVNGDFYGEYSGKTVVRNGVRVAEFVNTYDLCVLYEDGRMKAWPHQELGSSRALDRALEDAWQVWSFGPVLLRENGQAIDDFSAHVPEFINERHPRTCIGYYAPGHYCILYVAGYWDDMPGVTLEELSRFFSELGCLQAYNLDGGTSSHVWFRDREIGWPIRPELLSDLIYIQDRTTGKDASAVESSTTVGDAPREESP